MEARDEFLKRVLRVADAGDPESVAAALGAHYGPGESRLAAEEAGLTEFAYDAGGGGSYSTVFRGPLLLGVAALLPQVALPGIPCPCPGPAGSVTGIGTSTGPAFVPGIALVRATRAAWASLNALVAMICPAVCPPPCRCDTALGVPPLPTVTVTGLTMSVTVTLSKTLTCA